VAFPTEDASGRSFDSRDRGRVLGHHEACIVRREPEGGKPVGKGLGSGVIDARNQIEFDDVRPGRYVIQGEPNSSQ
jgi:hypothetical protein